MSNSVRPYFPFMKTKTQSGSDMDISIYLHFINCNFTMNNVQEEMLHQADRKKMWDYSADWLHKHM